MAYDISVKTTSVVTSKGKKTYYSFDVVDPATGQIKDSKNTSNPKKAKDLLAKYKKQYKDSTVNGKAGADPFEDGTFGKQSDFQFGGFQGEDDYQKMSGNITEKSFAPIGSSPARSGAKAVHSGKSNLSKDKQYVHHLKSTRLVEWRTKTGTHWHDQKGPPPISGLTQRQKDDALANGALRLQALVHRPKTASEVIVGQGVDNNAFIIIGHDRVEKEHTGYGGQSHTQCDAIDIVAGMGGPHPREIEYESDKLETPKIDSKTGLEVVADTHPSVYNDAARIYISQKTNVDKNFGIGAWAKGKKTQAEIDNPENIGKYGAKSAIAIKADNIRVIGRESLRLVTGTDQRNSQGGDISGKSGIEIVAMNNIETLQPMVLGDNLQLALTTIIDNIEAMAKIFEAYTKYQMKFNAAMQKHTHITPFFALPALPSQEAIISGIQCDIETFSRTSLSIVKHITNLQGVKHNFLTDSGDGFINSRLNKVN
tara:strand:+ start:8584 stop:10029 length:1446 start_codon:yes stop_codon:yes gene_type:complete